MTGMFSRFQRTAAVCAAASVALVAGCDRRQGGAEQAGFAPRPEPKAVVVLDGTTLNLPGVVACRAHPGSESVQVLTPVTSFPRIDVTLVSGYVGGKDSGTSSVAIEVAKGKAYSWSASAPDRGNVTLTKSDHSFTLSGNLVESPEPGNSRPLHPFTIDATCPDITF